MKESIGYIMDELEKQILRLMNIRSSLESTKEISILDYAIRELEISISFLVELQERIS